MVINGSIFVETHVICVFYCAEFDFGFYKDGFFIFKKNKKTEKQVSSVA